MITRCANSNCQQELHYLRDGHIIAVDIRSGGSTRVEHFWLCGICCKSLEFDRMQEGHMQLRPKSIAEDATRASLRKPPAAQMSPDQRMRR